MLGLVTSASIVSTSRICVSTAKHVSSAAPRRLIPATQISTKTSLAVSALHAVPLASSSRQIHSSAMPHVKIYTKTGDGGKSSLFNGERRSKNDDVFEALGTVDELNASIGLCYEYAQLADHLSIVSQLNTIQSTLLDLGSHIATPKTSEASDEKHLQRANFVATDLLATMEQDIDEMDKELPPLRNFILPSGGLCAAHLHVARAVCRRAERTLAPLLQRGDIDEDAFKYINRLSDYFFMAARYAAFKEGKAEQVYKKARSAPSSSDASL